MLSSPSLLFSPSFLTQQPKPKEEEEEAGREWFAHGEEEGGGRQGPTKAKPEGFANYGVILEQINYYKKS